MKIDHEHYKALGQEIRLEMARWLNKYPHLQPGFFAKALDISPSSVSQHLSTMHEAGLVSREMDGREIFYRLTDLGRKMIK